MPALDLIMVPLDGSNSSEQALPLARTLAEKFDSQILLLRVMELHTPRLLLNAIGELHPEITLDWVREARQHTKREAETYLESQRDQLRERGLNVEILVRGEHTEPAEGIIDTATSWDVDLIVMSSRGRGDTARWSFGSVANKVVRRSPCPVLLT